MKKIILLTLFFAIAINATAQSNQEKAKAYYFSAVEQYESSNYDKAIEYCRQVEDLLGGTNARVEALRLKSYFDSDSTQRAKESLDLFLTLGADDNLLQEVSPYIVKIEEAEKQRIEEERVAEEARIQKEKEEAEKKARLIDNAIFSEGMGLVVGENGKYGYIDREGNVLIDFNYKNADLFNNGYAVVENEYNDKYGVINKSGEVVIDYKYDALTDFNENGFACYQKPNEGSKQSTYPYAYGILNKDGEELGGFISSEDLGQTRWSVYYNTAYYDILQNDNKYPYKNKDNYIDLDKLWLMETLINTIPEDDEYYSRAQLEMARFHFYGRSNIIVNFNKAFEYYSKAWEDESILNKYDFENIGDMYYNGLGTGQNKERSLDYYKKMAESYSEPDEQLAKYFINLIDLGQFDKAELEIDKAEQQIKDERKLTKEIHYNPTIFYCRAYLYDKKGDTKEALKWYKKADKNNFHIDYDRTKQRIEELK